VYGLTQGIDLGTILSGTIYGLEVSMERVSVIRDIHRLNHQLERFERKHSLMSRTFYEIYSAGQEPLDDTCILDFAEWAGLYEIWRDRQRAYAKLVERLRENDVDLYGQLQSTEQPCA
jgi:hypothetical protein